MPQSCCRCPCRETASKRASIRRLPAAHRRDGANGSTRSTTTSSFPSGRRDPAEHRTAAERRGAGSGAAGIDASRSRHPDRRFSAHAQRAVFAAGDVCQASKFTNVAEVTGRMAAHNALGGAGEAAEPFDDSLVHLLHAGDRAYRHGHHGSCGARNLRQELHGDDAGCRPCDHRWPGRRLREDLRAGGNRHHRGGYDRGDARQRDDQRNVRRDERRIGMRQLARVLHAYPAQSDAIRLAALAYIANHPADS
jgi:hypothetical protein